MGLFPSLTFRYAVKFLDISRSFRFPDKWSPVAHFPETYNLNFIDHNGEIRCF